jgi:RNA polymerase-binding transcription factor DksA
VSRETVGVPHEQQKSALQARLATLQERLANIKRDVTRAHSGDSAEQAQERENDEVIDAIGNETRASIRDIQAALMRIEDGTYGSCEVCGGEIAPSRLQAIPEATRCVECAD